MCQSDTVCQIDIHFINNFKENKLTSINELAVCNLVIRVYYIFSSIKEKELLALCSQHTIIIQI